MLGSLKPVFLSSVQLMGSLSTTYFQTWTSLDWSGLQTSESCHHQASPRNLLLALQPPCRHRLCREELPVVQPALGWHQSFSRKLALRLHPALSLLLFLHWLAACVGLWFLQHERFSSEVLHLLKLSLVSNAVESKRRDDSCVARKFDPGQIWLRNKEFFSSLDTTQVYQLLALAAATSFCVPEIFISLESSNVPSDSLSQVILAPEALQIERIVSPPLPTLNNNKILSFRPGQP